MKPPHEGQAVPKIQDYTARNRENQRNFRKRRQERIQELEEKVRQVTHARIEATQEVQAAARAVATENGILKAYLKDDLGMSERDIIELIWSRQQPAGQQTIHKTTQTARVQLSLPARSETHAYRRPVQCNDDLLPRADEQKPKLPELLDRSSTSEVSSLAETVIRTHSNVMKQNDMLSEKTRQPVSIERLPITSEDKDTASMSCEKAAEILSGIRNHNGADELRDELGCTSASTCKVKNIRLLQIMSET